MAIIGVQYTNLQTLTITSSHPSGEIPLILAPYSTVPEASLWKRPKLGTIAYAKKYYYSVTSLTQIDAYQYLDNTPFSNLTISDIITNGQIIGIYAT